MRQTGNLETNNPRANVIFADTLTFLLEGVARIVEIHQPLVETYYGPGRLLQVVEHLQPECDKQASQVLVEFRRTRQLDKQIRQVSEALSNSRYAFIKVRIMLLNDVNVQFYLSAAGALWLRNAILGHWMPF